MKTEKFSYTDEAKYQRGILVGDAEIWSDTLNHVMEKTKSWAACANVDREIVCVEAIYEAARRYQPKSRFKNYCVMMAINRLKDSSELKRNTPTVSLDCVPLSIIPESEDSVCYGLGHEVIYSKRICTQEAE